MSIKKAKEHERITIERNRHLWKNIREVLDEKGLTLNDLAKRVGMNPGDLRKYYGTFERNIGANLFGAICEQLGVHPRRICCGRKTQKIDSNFLMLDITQWFNAFPVVYHYLESINHALKNNDYELAKMIVERCVEKTGENIQREKESFSDLKGDNAISKADTIDR